MRRPQMAPVVVPEGQKLIEELFGGKDTEKEEEQLKSFFNLK
jgi:hypothetical protein